MGSFSALRSVTAMLSPPAILVRRTTHVSRHIHSSRTLFKFHSDKFISKIKFARFRTTDVVYPDGQLRQNVTPEELFESVDIKQFAIQIITQNPHFVKVIDRTELARSAIKSEDLEKERKWRENSKEFQFTWSMGSGDIDRKLGRIRDELERGANVAVVFSSKSKTQPSPHYDEVRTHMESIVEQFSDIAEEWKSMEIVRGMAAVYLRTKKRGAR